MKPVAVIFDFDGTILDTETPIYEAWCDIYREQGVEPFSLEQWTSTIGQAADHFDAADELAKRLGQETLDPSIEEGRREHRNRILDALPLRSGIAEWIGHAEQLSLPLGIASSSPISWVGKHIDERQLNHHFSTVSCFGDGVPGKPAPDVYLRAALALGVDPKRCLAIEDSPTGVKSAVDAGMTCIAAPGPITRGLDFPGAAVVVDNLSDLDPAVWIGEKAVA